MQYPIQTSFLQPDLEFYSEVIKMNRRASDYLKGFHWCKEIKDSMLYLNLGATLCIFLYEIDNSSSHEDTFFWIIVGDIPSMYLDIYGPKTTHEVLGDFVFLSRDWISNVELGLSVEDCYPFDHEPTMELADLLKKRADFIENSILPNVDEMVLPPLLRAL